jgi:hypothetical protein
LENTPRAAAAAAIYPRAAVASAAVAAAAAIYPRAAVASAPVAAAATIYPRAAVAAAAAAIGLKFHPKHVTNKNKTKHIMKKSYINVSIYDKTATSQQIVTKMLNKHEN